MRVGGSEGGGGGEMMQSNVLLKKNWESHYRVFKMLYYYITNVSIPSGFSIIHCYSNVFNFCSLNTIYPITINYISFENILMIYDRNYISEDNKHIYCDSNFAHRISLSDREKIEPVGFCYGINFNIKLDFRFIIQERAIMPYKINITACPDRTFEVPVSDGYQLYSSILNQINKSDPQVSALIHDSNNISLSVGSLEGIFKSSSLKGYKILENINKYKFNIGIILKEELRVYQAIARSLILDDGRINLLNGSLIVIELKDTNESFNEIAKSCDKYNRPLIEFSFKTTTCIQYKNSNVTEMFPHRSAVYLSLLSKWNHSCPDDLELTITNDEIARYVIEKPMPERYCTHSVLVNTVHNEKSNTIKPIFKQGFRGMCVYTFTKDAPRRIQDIIITLSKFAEYSGVGSSVSRGCGCVDVKITEA